MRLHRFLSSAAFGSVREPSDFVLRILTLSCLVGGATLVVATIVLHILFPQ